MTHLLQTVRCPNRCLDTLWVSGYELYDRLSPPYQKFFESLTAKHHSTVLYGAAQSDPRMMDPLPRGAPNNKGLDFSSHHPVIRTHPLTGWKSLFAGGVNCFRYDGVTLAESADLMKKVQDLVVENHDMQVRFRWESDSDLGRSYVSFLLLSCGMQQTDRSGATAIWDNRCTFHAATFDTDGAGSRVGWRCMTMGEVPYLAENSVGRKEVTGGANWEDKVW